MSAKLKLFSAVIVFILLLTGYYCTSIQQHPTTHKLLVMQVNDEWKVVDAKDSTTTKIEVHAGDSIIWRLVGTDAYFQFNDQIYDPATPADSLSNGYTKFLSHAKVLHLKIKNDTPNGEYYYAVFCTAFGVFAQGDSPPKIIVN